MSKVKTAVIPVAGLGTRFLPATKSIPKEMLPIVDKPTIQYIVEEAWSAGIETVVFVNGHHKSSIEDHFDYAYELEDTLSKRGKEAVADGSRAIADRGAVVSVRQKAPLGLGHAVLAARPVIGDAPFAVLLGDDIIRPPSDSEPAIGQLMEAFDRTGKGQIALMQVPLSEIHKYGAAEGEKDPENAQSFHITALVEKPPPGTEKTDQAVVGRYVLPPSIWSILVETGEGAGGEIQLTDALDTLREQEGLMGCCFRGQRVDAGDKVGYLHANLLEALSRDDLKEPVMNLLKSMVAETNGQ
ncbi:MAG: UTP--glucose-1-phosphate uridylyltransferase [Myxococcales bacterium]|nr:UTP--glucose-1-phosphate uridylyltransferase [Myxococcales bacterium]